MKTTAYKVCYCKKFRHNLPTHFGLHCYKCTYDNTADTFKGIGRYLTLLLTSTTHVNVFTCWMSIKQRIFEVLQTSHIQFKLGFFLFCYMQYITGLIFIYSASYFIKLHQTCRLLHITTEYTIWIAVNLVRNTYVPYFFFLEKKTCYNINLLIFYDTTILYYSNI